MSNVYCKRSYVMLYVYRENRRTRHLQSRFVATPIQSHGFLCLNPPNMVNQQVRCQSLEYISRYKPDDAVFGIAEVESQNRCRLTIGYFIGDNTLSLILPLCCRNCPHTPVCTREFGEQIIHKYNQRHRGQEIFFVY
jgi:hypothetical protein